MARVKVFTDRGWIEIPPRYTDISVIEDRRFEITDISGFVRFSCSSEYISEYGEYTDEQIRMIHCKDCKYYHEDFWGEIDGLPIIIAHQICSKWGNGCKTLENGYCHFGEQRGKE